MHKLVRKEKGSALLLVVFCAFILVMLIWAGFEYSKMLLGSRHARHSVDAAVLNIAKRAPEVRIPTDVLFLDVADSEGKVGLSNINRVWGKAFLINANVQDMKEEEVHTDEAVSHGDTAYKLAQWVNDRLQAKLMDRTTLNKHFQEIADLRRLSGDHRQFTRMTDDTFTCAMVGRGNASNLSFRREQLPGKTSADGCDVSGVSYIKGYSPFKVNQRNFAFVSFSQNEMPQLISDQLFSTNRSDTHPIREAGNPVCNAFAATGVISGASSDFKASASGLANPQTRFTLALPRAYITVQFRNRAKWFFENKWVNETSYGFNTEVQNGIPYKENNLVVGKPFRKGGGYLDGWASLGNEYKDATLSKSLELNPEGKKLAMEKMLQRIREIKADFTMTDLVTLFAREVVVPHAAKYYIYPVYHTSDLTDPEIVMTADLDDLPKWMDAESKPEGDGKIVCDQDKLIDEPNYCWGERVGGGFGGTFDHWTEVSGRVWWKPGTGYGQCLGEMRYEHLTEVFFKSPELKDERDSWEPDGNRWLNTGVANHGPLFRPAVPQIPGERSPLKGVATNAGPRHLTRVMDTEEYKPKPGLKPSRSSGTE